MRALKRAAAGGPADPADPKRRKPPPAVPALRRAFPIAPNFRLPPRASGGTRDEPSTAQQAEPEGGETPPESAPDARRARRARSHPVSPSPPPERAGTATGAVAPPSGVATGLRQASATPAADPPGAARGPAAAAAGSAGGAGPRHREADRLLCVWLKRLQHPVSCGCSSPGRSESEGDPTPTSTAGPDPHALRLAQHLHRRYLAVTQQPRQRTKKGRYLPAPTGGGPAAAADLAACLWLALKLSSNQTAVPRAGAVGAVAGVARDRVVAREAAVACALEWKLLEDDPSVRAAPELAAPPGTP